MSKIVLIFGGMGNESSVSIVSAKNIVKHFDYKKHKLSLIFWDKSGFFYLVKKIEDCLIKSKRKLVDASSFKKYDVAFLVTHGKYGEDGVLQGILESQKVLYTGCHVLSSALCMDKAVLKELMIGHHIPQVDFTVIDFKTHSKQQTKKIILESVKKIGMPMFIKPANSGSSVGITRVTKQSQISKAIKTALIHDSKVILEQGLNSPREIEIGVLGNGSLIISPAGEIQLAKEFYEFEDKYQKGEAKPIIPALITHTQASKIRELADRIYRLCDCRGFARIDFFIERGNIFFNEINTLPGFTDVSMYPLLMFNAGINYKKLINAIIDLAKS